MYESGLGLGVNAWWTVACRNTSVNARGLILSIVFEFGFCRSRLGGQGSKVTEKRSLVDWTFRMECSLTLLLVMGVVLEENRCRWVFSTTTEQEVNGAYKNLSRQLFEQKGFEEGKLFRKLNLESSKFVRWVWRCHVHDRPTRDFSVCGEATHGRYFVIWIASYVCMIATIIRTISPHDDKNKSVYKNEEAFLFSFCKTVNDHKTLFSNPSRSESSSCDRHHQYLYRIRVAATTAAFINQNELQTQCVGE